MEVPKKMQVPLDEALSRAGTGIYTNYVMVAIGLVIFSAVLGIQAMAVVMPVAGCELALTSYQKGLLSSSAFGGMILSSFFFGFVADIYGRRKTMLCCIALAVVLVLLASLSPDAIILCILWFCNGFFLGGVLTSAWVYISEFCPQEIRARGILVPACLSSLALVFLPSLAWLVLPLKIAVPLPFGVVFTSWRLNILLITVPMSISWGLLYNLPESPKFTLNNGYAEKTLKTLRSIYAINNHAKEIDYPVECICLDFADMMSGKKEKEGDKSFGLLVTKLAQQYTTLFTPPLLFYTLLSTAVLFGAIGVFNTLYLWYPEQVATLMKYSDSRARYNATICDIMASRPTTLEEFPSSCTVNNDIFVITMITAVLLSTLNLIVSFIADRVGKKQLLAVIGVVSTATCIAMIYANSLLLSVSTLSVTLILQSVLFPIIYSIVVDFFPTSLRSTASSLTMAFGRFGAAGGSQIMGAMFENYCTQAYWGMSAIIVSTLIISISMPTKRLA